MAFGTEGVLLGGGYLFCCIFRIGRPKKSRCIQDRGREYINIVNAGERLCFYDTLSIPCPAPPTFVLRKYIRSTVALIVNEYSLSQPGGTLAAQPDDITLTRIW